MKRFFNILTKPFQLIKSAGNGIDTVLTYGRRGTQHIQAFTALLKHLEAFNNDRKRIYKIKETVNNLTPEKDGE